MFILFIHKPNMSIKLHLQVYGHRKYSCLFAETFFAVDVTPRNFTPGDSVA